jgi:hypothetical protein
LELFCYEALGIKSLDPGQLKLARYFNDPTCERIAAQAASGTGKTFIEACMILHFLTCRGDEKNHPKGMAVAINWNNLMANLWTELARLVNNNKTMSALFKWQQNKIVNLVHPSDWYFEARAWDKNAKGGVTEALGLAGHHAKYSFVVLDESSGMPKAVMNAAERTLGTNFGDDGTGIASWCKIFQGGNPTTSSGPLWDAANSQKKMWNNGTGPVVMTCDPDDPEHSPRARMDWARNLIETLGRNDSYVQVYVLGQFPDTAFNTFLSPKQVEDAMNRDVPPSAYNFMKMWAGVDVAFEGDDMTSIAPRQGLKCFELRTMRINPNSEHASMDIAQAIADYSSVLKFDQVVVDITGGYGRGVREALSVMGIRSQGVNYASGSGMMTDGPQFANKRAEMWWKMAQWVKNGGCLPRDADLPEELSAPTYTLINGKIQVEPKILIKRRLGKSPDKGDSLAQTFAYPDSPRDEVVGMKPIKVKTTEGMNLLGKYR